MVWYIPPLSPVADIVDPAGCGPDQVFATVDALRIPIDYLANLFTAGDGDTIRHVLRKLAAIRTYMRAHQLGSEPPKNLLASVGASPVELHDLYRLLAIAKYDERYVIPKAHAEDAGRLMAQHEQLFCSLDTEGGPGMGGHGPPDVETFHSKGGPKGGQTFRDGNGRRHFNLLGWNGHGSAPYLFGEGDLS
ncbi:hypothetical protein [Saccharopolyspora sp. ASAGF58]|uniref:hypothetical protein n=1 Tax=Saccharopolyspora sp. ASAGF58 TaxID=2719023 RepID=UPI00352FF700